MTLAPNGQVHPAAALFPTLGEEELDDLAVDIRANGLVHPIVLDHEGTLVDGRNRLEACRRAGVEPSYMSLNGHEPVAFILSANVARRHLTQGQRAMAVAKGLLLSSNWMSQVEAGRTAGVNRELVRRAAVVLEYAPELADQVLAGGSLNEAYGEALRRKRLPEREAERRRQAEAARQAEDERVAREEERWRQAIQLAIEEIGPEIPIRPAPDLTVDLSGPEEPPDPAPALNLEQLQAQDRALKQLIDAKRILERLAETKPAQADWWPESHVMAVRSAVAQIVDLAYAIAEVHNCTLTTTTRVRAVK
jgi:ParB-like chromosome segregation protein Spo0J